MTKEKQVEEKVEKKQPEKESLSLSQAKEENKKKIEKLSELEKNMIKLICLYSIMDAQMIGPVLAKLISEFEGLDYEYYELLADRLLTEEDRDLFSKKSIKEKKAFNRHCQYVIAKKNVMNAYDFDDRTIIQMEMDRDALIFHEAAAPVNRIAFFNSENYISQVSKYVNYPYVLDFLDFVISKKAKLYNYKLNVYPQYSEIELYSYLKEFIEVNLLKLREKEPLREIVKTLILKKDS